MHIPFTDLIVIHRTAITPLAQAYAHTLIQTKLGDDALLIRCAAAAAGVSPVYMKPDMSLVEQARRAIRHFAREVSNHPYKREVQL